MSQVHRRGGIVPPGAGVLTLTPTDTGVAIPPTGGGTIFIDGAGGLTATGAGNTVTITNTLGGSQFVEDIGTANFAGGILNILGRANQIQTAGIGNTVTIGMTLDVLIDRDLNTIRDVNSGNNVNATIDVNAGNDVIAANQVSAGAGLRTNAGGIGSFGPVFLSDPTLPRGVMQIDGIGNVFSSEGTNGQFIIGSNTGPSLWGTLTSAGGTVTITPGSNFINIEANPTAALTFQAEDATTANPIANIIQFVGDPNINSTAGGNIVTYSLANNVHITGTMTADAGLITLLDVNAGQDITAVRDIDSTFGNINALAVGVGQGNITARHNITANDNITATTGNITATAGNMVATAGSVIANQQLVSQVNGSSITGPAIFPLLNEGVARINATNTLYSSNGTDGQILIGSSTGPTQWSSLTSDGSITITPGHNSVQLSTAAPRSAYFQFQQPDTGYLWGHLPNIWFGDGTPTLTLLQDNTGGCFRGAPGTPASYHCPTALGGMYTFIIRTAFYTLAHRGIGECRSRMTIQLGWPTPIQQYIFHLVSNPFMGIEPFNGEYSETFWVAPGQYVIFGIEYYHPNITYDVGLNNTTTITGYLVS